MLTVKIKNLGDGRARIILPLGETWVVECKNGITHDAMRKAREAAWSAMFADGYLSHEYTYDITWEAS